MHREVEKTKAALCDSCALGWPRLRSTRKSCRRPSLVSTLILRRLLKRLHSTYNGILLVVDEIHNLKTFEGIGSFFKVVSEAWAVDGYRNTMFAVIGLPDVPVSISKDDPSAPRIFVIRRTQT